MDAVVADIAVRQIAVATEQVLGKPVQISRSTDIARDLEVDSLSLMNIVMELEDTLDLSVPLDRLAQVQTVGDLANVLASLRVGN